MPNLKPLKYLCIVFCNNPVYLAHFVSLSELESIIDKISTIWFRESCMVLLQLFSQSFPVFFVIIDTVETDLKYKVGLFMKMMKGIKEIYIVRQISVRRVSTPSCYWAVLLVHLDQIPDGNFCTCTFLIQTTCEYRPQAQRITIFFM